MRLIYEKGDDTMNFQTDDILHNTVNGIPQNEISDMINLLFSKKIEPDELTIKSKKE